MKYQILNTCKQKLRFSIVYEICKEHAKYYSQNNDNYGKNEEEIYQKIWFFLINKESVSQRKWNFI